MALGQETWSGGKEIVGNLTVTGNATVTGTLDGLTTAERAVLDGATAGTVVASKVFVAGADKGIAGIGPTTFVNAGGTAILSTNTAADTTTARCKFQSTSPGDGTEVGDLLGAYGLATVALTDTVADAHTIAGVLAWTEVLTAGGVSASGGGSVIAASRHILQVKQDLTGVSGRAAAIIYAEAWDDAVGGDIAAGVYILNNQETANKTFEAGVYIASGGGAGGGADFLYGIDMANAAITTAHIRLGQVGGEDVVIAVGNFVDGADSGFAPGSVGLDINDGLFFSCDSAGLWQQMAYA